MKLLARENRTLLFIAILSFSLAAAFVCLRLALPSDGTRLEPGLAVPNPNGWSIAVLTGRPTGLRDGDLVIARRPHEPAARALLIWGMTNAQTRIPKPHGSWTSERSDLGIPVQLTDFATEFRGYL